MVNQYVSVVSLMVNKDILCMFTLCSFSKQSLREPIADPGHLSPPASIPKSGSSGMVQYLQSWFPGWGGWYGDSQGQESRPDGQGMVPDDLLPGHGSWDILGQPV